jgi:hypothetical protein
LFRMNEGLLRQQHRQMQSGLQKRIWEGTYSVPENVEKLVYITLTNKYPELKSSKRQEVIEGIKNADISYKTLREIGFTGLMNKGLPKEDANSPRAILKFFDNEYRRKTRDRFSLFDLSQTHHLHEWEVMGSAGQKYWQNPQNRQTAVYHILTKKHPELNSKDRQRIVNEIGKFPKNLYGYFLGLGLQSGMWDSTEEKDSPLSVLKAFDKEYQKQSGDRYSLFDLSHTPHLHEWKIVRNAGQCYWKNPENVQKAIYHTLIEQNPELASTDREELINGIKQFPNQLLQYLKDKKLTGILTSFPKGQKGSVVFFMQAFDREFQEQTGEPSLFDSTLDTYLESHRYAGHNHIRVVEK